jgi:hypothetical protein
MNLSRTLGLALAVMAALPFSTAQATTIGQDQRSGIYQVEFYGQMGQSFTAVDPFLASIGFTISSINAHLPLADLGVRLYEGNGFGGSVLATVNASPQPVLAFPFAYFDWNFGGLALTPGQAYTAELITTNAHWGTDVFASDTVDAYAGGTAFTGGLPGITLNDGLRHAADLRFQVNGFSAPVPELSTVAMLAAGLAVLTLGMRRRR